MTSADLVTLASVAAGAICFVLYVWQTIAALRHKPADDTSGVGKKAALAALKSPGVSIDDITKLLDSVSKLTDSLAKAGPALTSLIGAILFFAIAALSSGALHGAPATATPATAVAKAPGGAMNATPAS